MEPSDCIVLIIDDEEDLLEIMQDSFEIEDFKVEVAKNGQQAKEILNAKEMDIVISDENMPGISGHDLLSFVRSKEGSEKTLFYFSTGDVDANEDKMIEEGATGLLQKPFDIDDVIQKMINKIKEI